MGGDSCSALFFSLNLFFSGKLEGSIRGAGSFSFTFSFFRFVERKVGEFFLVFSRFFRFRIVLAMAVAKGLLTVRSSLGRSWFGCFEVWGSIFMLLFWLFFSLLLVEGFLTMMVGIGMEYVFLGLFFTLDCFISMFFRLAGLAGT